MVNVPKLTLFGVVAVTIGTIGYVHYAQELERLELKKGVERDLERQRLKALAKEARENPRT